MTWNIANVVAKSMLDDYLVDVDAGTAAIFKILDGSIPTDADTAESGTEGGTLLCTATASAAAADAGPGAEAVYDTIADESSAPNGITTTYFRHLTQAAGTVIAQGACATSGQELNWNTLTISAGAVLSITAFTATLPES